MLLAKCGHAFSSGMIDAVFWGKVPAIIRWPVPAAAPILCRRAVFRPLKPGGGMLPAGR
ncbi:hypothetical protein SXCC_01728 [Gluconacetobacter sp. SXCC-1]|nr:hypothetical protein SXCC_01728 [Gluconacetobacter sp. SXCC-1]